VPLVKRSASTPRCTAAAPAVLARGGALVVCLCVLAAPAVAAISEPAAAGTPGPSTPKTLTLDVLVTDPNGRPIPGLTAADFELSVDGAPAAITAFEAPAPAALSPAPPRFVMLFLAAEGDRVAASTAARDAATVIAEVLAAPGGRVAVVAGSSGLTLRQRFTREAALAVQRLAAADDPEVPVGEDAPRDPTRWITNLGLCVGALAALPGRKALVVVGAASAAGDNAAGHATAAARGGEPPAELQVIADEANAGGVTIWGLGGDPAAGDDLATLAAATGGGLVAPGAGPGEAAIIAAALCKPYALGFAVASGGPAAHAVRVAVRREGARVHAREAVAEADLGNRMAELALARLLLDEGENPLGIQVSVTAETRPRQGSQEATVLVEVPLANVRFVPGPLSHDCEVWLWLAAGDAKGTVIRSAKAVFPVSVPNERLLAALAQRAAYTFRVPMRAGPGRFAVAAYEPISGRRATAVAVLTPPGGRIGGGKE
jgi:VWFA-related protein